MGTSWSAPTRLSAPPCERTTAPDCESASRSPRTVTAETPKRLTSSSTVTRACFSTRSSVWRGRSATRTRGCPDVGMSRDHNIAVVAHLLVSFGCDMVAPEPMRSLAICTGALLAGALAVSAAAADKPAEHWLRDIRLLVLPEEDALYAQLKDPADRAEFERLFWARRDAHPATAATHPQ